VIYTLKLEGGNIAPAVVSDNIERLLGVTVEECSSFDWWLTSLHPEDRERVAGGLGAALARGGYSKEYRIRAKDGSYRWIEDNNRVIRDASGQPVEAVGVWMDITERKQSEQRLAEQAALLDQANDAILVHDLEHRIRYWNKCAERLYGWSAAEAAGKSVKTLLQRDPAAFNAAIEATIRDGEWAGEIAQFSRDGRELSVEARWTLVRDSTGHAGSILAINTDITEKKKLEAQFLRAQRMESIGTLAGGIAHDLNNVLAPILMSIQLIEEEVRSEDARSMLATMQTCAQRGADLVRQVLSFARGAEGERIEVNVGHLLRDVSHVILETFPKNIQSAFHAGPDLWRVGGDPTQLHQVFMNLCVNARDAMPEGGRLLIQAANEVLDNLYAGMSPESRPGPYLVVKVEDTGVGIPARIQERIFEPFFTTKDTGKGTGLGLSTTLGIVRSHGGFIQVTSEQGKGTTFKVYLPALASQPVIDEPVAERARLPRGHGELVLVVDDEAAIREITRKTLDLFGYRVLVAGNGAEAVALYASHREEIAIVLTDMAMPIMDGPSMIVALKALNPRVRIVATSGLDIEGAQAKSVGAGILEFIPKPFTAEALLNVLEKLVVEPTQPDGH
jgi:PAS domain S-box-containing protein